MDGDRATVHAPDTGDPATEVEPRAHPPRGGAEPGDQLRRRRHHGAAGPRGRGGQRAAVEHAVTSRPHAIPGDGVATDAEVPGDPTIRLAQLQPPENLTDVGHRTPRSRHSSPPGVGVLQRGFLVTARTRKESGHAPPGGSLWPTLGGSGWATLPGSRWSTPGGSASPTPVDHYGVAADKRQAPCA